MLLIGFLQRTFRWSIPNCSGPAVVSVQRTHMRLPLFRDHPALPGTISQRLRVHVVEQRSRSRRDLRSVKIDV